MNLYESWQKMSEGSEDPEAYNAFWEAYFSKEKDVYERILKEQKFEVRGTVLEAAENFGLSAPEFAGFIDGINTSLTIPVDLTVLDQDTGIALLIEPEKLYYNMLNAEADWLYNLEAWEDVLDEEKRIEIKKNFNRDRIFVRETEKVGRNDPCPCGSGKKYKKCCGKNS